MGAAAPGNTSTIQSASFHWGFARRRRASGVSPYTARLIPSGLRIIQNETLGRRSERRSLCFGGNNLGVRSLPEPAQEFGDRSRPARLMTRADPRAVVAMEVLVEEDMVAPV